VTSGSYSITGVSTAYQWLRDGAVITGVTGTQYLVTAADSKARLSVRVTASKPGYTSVTTTTAATAKVH
jgi:beta-glucosidase